MPRIARVVAVGYPHHVTQRGNNREWVFLDDEDRSFYLTTLSRYSKKFHLSIWAYCLMNNHVHLLAVPRQSDSLAKSIGTTNLVYSQYFNRKNNRSGRIWQNRFFSCVVDRESYLWAVARYVERNPVRAGIVDQPLNYRWSSASGNGGGAEDFLLGSDEWLTTGERESYSNFLHQRDDEAETIRKATSTGRPLGEDRFTLRIETLTGKQLRTGKPGRPGKTQH